jgi:hypothetical protein
MDLLRSRESLQFLVGQDAKFFLTFSVLGASLLVEEWTMLKGNHHFHERGKVKCA